MKYIKTLNEAKYTLAFQKMNKLVYNDQISGRKSLSKTLAEDLGFNPKKEFTEGVGFDSVSLYDVKSGKTIIEDALSGKYTYDEILAKARDWYKKNESVDESIDEGMISPSGAKGFKIGNKIKTQKGTYTITGFGSKTNATRDFEAENENGDKFNLRVSLRGASGIQVAAAPSLNFPEKEEMLESIVNEAPMDKSFMQDWQKSCKALQNHVKHELDKIKSGKIKASDLPHGYYIYLNKSINTIKDAMDIPTHLAYNSGLNEAKKFKPGDKWSNDFDYDGMLAYALKVNEKTPLKTLQKLHDSATDVNYHTPFSGLGNAIDWITDDGVNSPEGKDFIKQFHNDIKTEMKN